MDMEKLDDIVCRCEVPLTYPIQYRVGQCRVPSHSTCKGSETSAQTMNWWTAAILNLKKWMTMKWWI